MDDDIQSTLKPIPYEPARRPSSEFPFPSDSQEKERLEIQHVNLKEIQGNRLILAPTTIPPNSCVLDSGTGSGAWLLDFMKDVPTSVELVGIDIQPNLFPIDDPRVLSRGNIHFLKESVVSLPASYSDKFAFVNQRLLLAGLQRHQWPQAIQEIRRVLAPGGWAQFQEFDSWTGNNIAVQTDIFGAWFDHRNLARDCARRIPGWMKDAGFVDISTVKLKLPLGPWAGKLGEQGMLNAVGVFKMFKNTLMEAGGLGFVRSEQEFDELADALRRDWEEHPGSEVLMKVIYGRKE